MNASNWLRGSLCAAKIELASLKSGIFALGNQNRVPKTPSAARMAKLSMPLLFLFIGITVALPTVFVVTQNYQIYGQNSIYVFLESLFVFCLFIGFSMTTAAFFSGEDVDSLLPLPLSAGQLVFGKFSALFAFCLLMTALYSLPGLIAYGVLSGAGWQYYLLLPVILVLNVGIAEALFSLINLLIGYAASFCGRARRAVVNICSTLIMFGLLAYYMWQNTVVMNPENGMVVIDNPAYQAVKYALLGGGSGHILSGDATGKNLLIMFALLTGLTAAFLLLSRFTFLRCVSGIRNTSGRKRRLSSEKLDQQTRSSGAVGALMLREWRMILRAPMMATNMLVGLFIFPVMILIMSLTMQSAGDQAMDELMTLLPQLIAQPAAVPGAFIIGLMSAGTAMFGSTTISREGTGLWYLKQIPVSLQSQLMGKLGIAWITSGVSAVLTAAAAAVLGMPAGLAVLCALSYTAAGCLMSVMGLAFDLRKPYLTWDADFKAVKQNVGAMLAMLPMLPLGIAAGLGAVYVKPLWLLCVLFVVLPGAAALLLSRSVTAKGAVRLAAME